jgi:hypothetical protein
METGSAKHVSLSPQPQDEFEDADQPSSMRDQVSSSPIVAMIVCNVILLLMFSA